MCLLKNLPKKIAIASHKTIPKIAPIINFRDFHATTPNAKFELKQHIKDTKVKVIINNQEQNPIYMRTSEGKYVEHYNDTFNNMYYIEEEKRGQGAEENLSVPGVFEIKSPSDMETAPENLPLNENSYFSWPETKNFL